VDGQTRQIEALRQRPDLAFCERAQRGGGKGPRARLTPSMPVRGSDAQAAAYVEVEIDGPPLWGVGVEADTTGAPCVPSSRRQPRPPRLTCPLTDRPPVRRRAVVTRVARQWIACGCTGTTGWCCARRSWRGRPDHHDPGPEDRRVPEPWPRGRAAHEVPFGARLEPFTHVDLNAVPRALRST